MPDTYPDEWYDPLYTHCPLCNTISRIVHLPGLSGLSIDFITYRIVCPTHDAMPLFAG